MPVTLVKPTDTFPHVYGSAKPPTKPHTYINT